LDHQQNQRHKKIAIAFAIVGGLAVAGGMALARMPIGFPGIVQPGSPAPAPAQPK
jgi:hypothetical protein